MHRLLAQANASPDADPRYGYRLPYAYYPPPYVYYPAPARLTSIGAPTSLRPGLTRIKRPIVCYAMGSRPVRAAAFTELEVKVLGFAFNRVGILHSVWVRRICQDAALSPPIVVGLKQANSLMIKPILTVAAAGVANRESAAAQIKRRHPGRPRPWWRQALS